MDPSDRRHPHQVTTNVNWLFREVVKESWTLTSLSEDSEVSFDQDSCIIVFLHSRISSSVGRRSRISLDESERGSCFERFFQPITTYFQRKTPQFFSRVLV